MEFLDKSKWKTKKERERKKLFEKRLVRLSFSAYWSQKKRRKPLFIINIIITRFLFQNLFCCSFFCLGVQSQPKQKLKFRFLHVQSGCVCFLALFLLTIYLTSNFSSISHFVAYVHLLRFGVGLPYVFCLNDINGALALQFVQLFDIFQRKNNCQK